MSLDEATLERLRRGLPLRLDRRGQFFLDDDPVSHPNIRAAFLAGLDRTPAGETTVHLGDQWCYLTVEDCPLRATGVVAGPDGRPQLRLDDGRTVALEPTSVVEDTTGLRCTVPAQRSGQALAVRLGNTAAMDLSAWLDPAGDAIVIAGQRTPIGRG